MRRFEGAVSFMTTVLVITSVDGSPPISHFVKLKKIRKVVKQTTRMGEYEWLPLGRERVKECLCLCERDKKFPKYHRGWLEVQLFWKLDLPSTDLNHVSWECKSVIDRSRALLKSSLRKCLHGNIYDIDHSTLMCGSLKKMWHRKTLFLMESSWEWHYDET